jgi:hypothetical protein
VDRADRQDTEADHQDREEVDMVEDRHQGRAEADTGEILMEDLVEADMEEVHPDRVEGMEVVHHQDHHHHHHHTHSGQVEDSEVDHHQDHHQGHHLLHHHQREEFFRAGMDEGTAFFPSLLSRTIRTTRMCLNSPIGSKTQATLWWHRDMENCWIQRMHQIPVTQRK